MDAVLGRLPRGNNTNVLVGFDTADDAGVYKLADNLAVVQTVDFFTPIVDDPYQFGQIAAANSLSDVYAMGGRPVSALSVVAFPGNGEVDVLEQILRGGLEKMEEAGCAVIGGTPSPTRRSSSATPSPGPSLPTAFSPTPRRGRATFWCSPSAWGRAC